MLFCTHPFVSLLIYVLCYQLLDQVPEICKVDFVAPIRPILVLHLSPCLWADEFVSTYLDHYDRAALVEEQTLKSGRYQYRMFVSKEIGSPWEQFEVPGSHSSQELRVASSQFSFPLPEWIFEPKKTRLTWAANKEGLQSLSRHRWMVQGAKWHQAQPGDVDTKKAIQQPVGLRGWKP